MKKIILTIILSFSLLTPVLAAGIGDAFSDQRSSSPIDSVAKGAKFQTGADNNIETIIQTFLNLLFSAIGAVFIVLIILAGLRWMTADGNQEQVTKARQSIKSSLIGLIVIILAYSVTYFVFSVFINQTITIDI